MSSGVDGVPSRYLPGPEKRSITIIFPSRGRVFGRTMFAHPPKYLLTIRCFFIEASVGASKKLASAIPVESTPAQSYQEKTRPCAFRSPPSKGAPMPHSYPLIALTHSMLLAPQNACLERVFRGKH